MECNICTEPFDSTERVPFVGKCGHSFCGICVAQLVQHTCAICREIAAFASPRENYLAKDLLQQKRTESTAKRTETKQSRREHGEAPDSSATNSHERLLAAYRKLDKLTEQLDKLTIATAQTQPAIMRIRQLEQEKEELCCRLALQMSLNDELKRQGPPLTSSFAQQWTTFE